MMRKVAVLCGAGILLLSALGVGLVGCTRAKPEVSTPTAAVAAVTTSTPTIGATMTPVLTPQPPPTTIPATTGPTVIRVTEITPTTPTMPSPTAPGVPTVPPMAGQFEYVVQWHDTLYSLARRFNTTVQAIVALNGLSDPNYIKVGQVLKIAGTSSPTPGPSVEYVVQPGDTLYSIARRYNTTVDAISRANGIVNPWYIQVGQKLSIPQGSTPPPSGGTTYVVQPGDTLYSIAARFGKNVWDIIVANNLADPRWIWVGQVLIIPS